MPAKEPHQGGEERVHGRVLSVLPLADGSGWTVLLGPPPTMYSFRAHGRPPKLGERLLVAGRPCGREPLEVAGVRGTLVTLEDARWLVDVERYPTRAVPAAWKIRVASVMRRPLYRYQVEGAAWAAMRLAHGEGALLCDDPGLGKTTQAIAAVLAAGLLPALVVCPGSLKHQWAREWGYATSPPVVRVIESRHGPLDPAHVHIVNYDLLRPRETQLSQVGYRVCVFDEIHALKEPRPHIWHRAAVATRLAHRIGRVLGLTGTPVLNRPEELWRLLHILDPDNWPDFAGFREAYCTAPRDTKKASSGRDAAAVAARLDELQVRIGPYLLRRLKSQVMRDLPPKSRRTILVSLNGRMANHYRAAERDVVAWLRSLGYGYRAEAAERAQAIVRLTMLRRLAALAKLEEAVPDYLRAWFDRSVPEPLVVFAYHRDVLLGLVNIARGLGLRVAAVAGGEPVTARQREVDRFQSGQADIFCGSIQVAGVGVNLQRASDVLFVERVWTPAELLQAEDRVHRIGSVRPVTITYLDAAGTIDEHLCRVLDTKVSVIGATLDEKIDLASQAVSTVTSVASALVHHWTASA